MFLHLSVSHSVWLWGGMIVGGVHDCGGCAWLQGGLHGCWGACMVARGAVHGGRRAHMVAGDMCGWGGMCGCGGEHALLWGSVCMVVGGMCGSVGGMHGIWWDMVNERVVHILLECILVVYFVEIVNGKSCWTFPAGDKWTLWPISGINEHIICKDGHWICALWCVLWFDNYFVEVQFLYSTIVYYRLPC